MSIEDETDLKDLLVQTLNENGTLAKLKAQLRASVFLALEEDVNLSNKTPLLNTRVKSSLNTSEGQLIFCIVKEFLEYFNLQSTMAVFDAESYLGVSYEYGGRSKVSTDLGLSTEDISVPLLQHVVKLAQQKPKTIELNLNINEVDTEVVDNNTSNSCNSIKTETSMNERNSNSGSSEGKTDKNTYTTSDYNISEQDNETEYNVSLNKTFITQPRHRIDTDDIINSNGVSMHVGSCNISEVPINETQVTMPVLLSDKFDEIRTPVAKDLKISPERVKSPPKSDKFKSRNNLNSLSDLPPLTMNKTLSGKILPSFYNKEFRERPNS